MYRERIKGVHIHIATVCELVRVIFFCHQEVTCQNLILSILI